MAEVAALTSAHNHVRRAGHETGRSDWKTAAEEHKLAAADFSRATRSTSDREALRTLSLLEAQHRKLAEIIHTRDVAPLTEPTQDAALGVASPGTPELQSRSSTNPQDVKDQPPSKILMQIEKTPRARNAIRDSSPSLARDIASRRGIPQHLNQPSAAAQARARQLSPESAKDVIPQATSASRIPPSVMDSQNFGSKTETPRAATSDDGFATFYDNLTTGTMSKLSSVLAYAGLPLGAAEEVVEPAAKPSRRTVKATAEPDVKKIYSKAALNAIEDDHKQRGLQGQAFGPTESFYVVQTGGGTLSYADIAKAQAQTSSIGGDDEEAFVDAHEAQPPSPRHNRSARKLQRVNFGNARTSEELELENTTLKQTLEQLASRLSNFEAHAQDASMAALTQSMATLRQPITSDAATQERVKLLEHRVEQQAEQREKLEELAKKQERKIRAYHAKWEEIKKNAREKEKTKREKQQGVEEDEATIDL